MKSSRKEMGLSVTRLAQLIGVSRSLLSLYEAGKRNLPAKASGMETRIIHLWVKISTATAKIPARLTRLLKKQEETIDKRLHWELVAAERKLSRLSKLVKEVPVTFSKEMMRYNLVDILCDWPELKKTVPALKKSRLTQERNIKNCSPAEQRWLNYCMELAQAQKALALKWSEKPMTPTKTRKAPHTNNAYKSWKEK